MSSLCSGGEMYRTDCVITLPMVGGGGNVQNRLCHHFANDGKMYRTDCVFTLLMVGKCTGQIDMYFCFYIII